MKQLIDSVNLHYNWQAMVGGWLDDREKEIGMKLFASVNRHCNLLAAYGWLNDREKETGMKQYTASYLY